MDRFSFEKLLGELQTEELLINRSKGKEYAQGDDDALLNFRMIADLFGDEPVVITPGVVCMIYTLKPVLSLAEYARLNGDVPSNEPIEGRVADARLYVALFLGLVRKSRMNC